MATGIHCRIEISTSHQDKPFESPDSIRCMSEGELFIFHAPLLFHALGLNHYADSQPVPKFQRRGFPDVLSHSLVRQECFIVSENEPNDVSDRCSNHPLITNQNQLTTWVSDIGFGDVLVKRVDHPQSYFPGLEKDEYLIVNPGNLCSSWLFREEIVAAMIHGEIEPTTSNEDKNISHFVTLLDWMQSLESVYGPRTVKLVYWFDTVPDEVVVANF